MHAAGASPPVAEGAAALHAWALARLPAATADASFTTVAGDASLRRYYRLAWAGGSAIACLAPPATEKNAEFVAVAAQFARAGVRVPQVLAADLAQGYLLLEDLGDTLLLHRLDAGCVDDCYGRAMALLVTLARAPCLALAPYDDDALAAELALFPAWFCDGLLQHPPGAAGGRVFDALCERLLASAAAQPRVPVHRDFHSRNLLVTAGGLATIDFQDAVCGPLTYDLVSLLKDCYVRWPARAVRRWALDFRTRVLAAGVPAPAEADFLRAFDLMGLQRHLKVLGIFARLKLRDGKAAYLGDLPRVLAYVRETLTAWPDEPALAAFAAWFEAELAPRFSAQPWWQRP